MTDPTPTKALDSLLDPDKFPNYQVRNPKEILRIMQMLQVKRVLMTAYIDGGPFTFVTAVLGVSDDKDAIMLDASGDPKSNARAAEAEQLVCAGRVDGVRVQFNAVGPVEMTYDGYQAIRCELPEMALRLQRRECFRQSVPMSNPVTCTIMVDADDGTTHTVSVRVLDISNEGVGIVASNELSIFELGKVLERCVLTIPDSGSTDVVLQLRNVYKIQSPHGGESFRAGCQFLKLPNQVVTQIQRYIYKVERDRRALETNS